MFLPERERGRAGAPFFRAEQLMSRRWKIKVGSDAPDYSGRSGLLGRKKQTQCCVAQSALAGVADAILLVDDRKDRACDQVPVRTERKRNDGLNVEFVLETVVLGSAADIEI